MLSVSFCKTACCRDQILSVETIVNLDPCLELRRVWSLKLSELEKVLEESLNLMFRKVWEPWIVFSCSSSGPRCSWSVIQ